jgi:hypothetical protein
MDSSQFREYVTDAIKFWESWRLLYNLALATIVVIYFGLAYPHSKTALTVDFCLGLFLLAVIANIAYCAAYIVDIFVQASFGNSGDDIGSYCSRQALCSPSLSLDLLRWECSQVIISSAEVG